MKREVQLLRERSINSLILAIEHFNRPSNIGRVEAVLIFLDHSFELLLKAAIVHRNGAIRKKGDKNTIGFDAAVRKSLTDGTIKFISEEQALTLQAINGLRDAAQHHILDISESQLYLHAQSGVTLFRDVYISVFGEEIAKILPDRILPISTHAPSDITTLFIHEIEGVRSLLEPGRRKRIEARAKVRALAIFENTVAGDTTQPGKAELNKICDRVRDGESWDKIFPSVASLSISANGSGANICLRLTKKEGIPIHLIPEGNELGYPVAIKRVNELDYYSLGIQQIAKKLEVSWVKLLELVNHLDLKKDDNCFKSIRIGSTTYKRYSPKALNLLSTKLKELDLDDIWANRKK